MIAAHAHIDTRMPRAMGVRAAPPCDDCVLDGKITVGSTTHRLRNRDEGLRSKLVVVITIAVAPRGDGATTVADDMWIANRVGIAVLRPGGIAECIVELSPTCRRSYRNWRARDDASGRREDRLDLAATREWLETQGVTVVGYGCSEMPAFYTRRSGLAVDVRADSAREVATLVRARNELGLEGAILVTVPVPIEAEVEGDVIESVLERA